MEFSVDSRWGAPPPWPPMRGSPMEIIVRRPVVCDGGYLSKTITLEVEQTDTIDTIRSLLAEIEDVPLQQCRLYKRETLLAEGSRPLSDYSIESGDTLHLRIEFQITI